MARETTTKAASKKPASKVRLKVGDKAPDFNLADAEGRGVALGDLLQRRPTEAIRRAVKGMLPKTKLATAQIRKLKIYAGAEHPHAPQRPETLA